MSRRRIDLHHVGDRNARRRNCNTFPTLRSWFCFATMCLFFWYVVGFGQEGDGCEARNGPGHDLAEELHDSASPPR